MNLNQYSINERSLSIFSSLSNELHFEKDKNYLFDLSYLSIITLTGDRSSEFLQGQVSCNVQEVNKQQMRQGALCNLKGRVLALMDVLEWQGIKLILPEDMQNSTMTTLAKTAAFSKVQVQSFKECRIFGFLYQNSKDLIPYNLTLPTEKHAVIATNDYICYSLGNNRFILIVLDKNTESMSSSFQKNNQWRGGLAWHKLQLENDQIEIYPLSRGIFLPHRLGLQNSSYLSFDKGCYKGQEIIARTHYRAKIKHKTQVFKIQTDEPLLSRSKLFTDDSNKEIGELIDFCPIQDGEYIIAVSILLEHPMTCIIEHHSKQIQLTPYY